MSTHRRLTVVLAILCLWVTQGAAAQPVTPTPLPTFPLDDVVGIPVEGNINDITPEIRYSFNGTAGTAVQLSMRATSGNLNPLVILFAPNGDELARSEGGLDRDQDAGPELRLPTDGVYTIQATRVGEDTGTTSGSYSLLLQFAGGTIPSNTVDPLQNDPTTLFGVPFTRLANQNFGSGVLSTQGDRVYFAIGGNEGSLLRIFLIVTEGNVTPSVNILGRGSNLAPISDSIRPRDGEVIAFATLPERDWYLVEVIGEGGSGSFSLFVEQLAVPQIAYDEVQSDQRFPINTPRVSYIFEGTIGDLIFASVNVSEGEATPEVRILDIAQRQVALAPSEENRDLNARGASLQALLPRSGTYILQVNNITPQTTGTFTLRLNSIERPVEQRFDLQPAEYNSVYDGRLSDETPQDVYTFVGSEGELITVTMGALEPALDPFLLLLDANLNELVFNDNTPGTFNASISPFSLPADGTYYIVAGRSGLSLGDSSGGYLLTLTVGEVELQPGIVSATVTWTGDDDLNLFIREPSGTVISWSNPASPDGGRLQIDSNTDCAITSAQPVEHILWEQDSFPVNGDYEIWVWYQNACAGAEPIDFSFQLRVDGAIALDVPRQRLEVGERFNIDIRVSEPQVFILDSGNVSRPSPQQRASEGGDIPILYGQEQTGNISEEVYARFYQFQGIEGDTIVVETERLTGSLDPILILRDDRENNLVESDDISRSNRNARITYTLPYTGRYVIAVTRFGVREGLTFGDYRLSLQLAEQDAPEIQTPTQDEDDTGG